MRILQISIALLAFSFVVSFFAAPVSAQEAKIRLGVGIVKVRSNGCVASLWALDLLPKVIVDNGIKSHLSDAISPSQINTKLMAAVVQGQLQAVESLIGQGVDIDAISPKHECTALIWAITFKRRKIFERLLNAGADVNLTDGAGRTPLMMAALTGSLSIAQSLIGAGADVNMTQTGGVNEIGRTALLYAATKDENVNLLRLLVEKGALIDAVYEHGNSALIEAAKGGQLENVRYLLSAGANREVKNNAGESAIDTARSRRQQEVVEFLTNY